jgi:hypothetical protein
VKVNIALPTAAFAAAVNVIFCAVPGVRESVAGCAVTPAGNPVIATLTTPEKLLDGTAFTLICCPVPPERSVTLAGVVVRVKSPSAAGLEPPQEINTTQKRKPEHPTRAFEKAPISTPTIQPPRFNPKFNPRPACKNLRQSGSHGQLH